MYALCKQDKFDKLWRHIFGEFDGLLTASVFTGDMNIGRKHVTMTYCDPFIAAVSLLNEAAR